jgi:tetratricopeptide (TPR) repeat protein
MLAARLLPASLFIIGLKVVAKAPVESPQLELLQQQAKQHPESYEANHRLGEFYVQQKSYSAAVPYLKKAYQADPNAYGNAYDLALAELLTGDTISAHHLVGQLLQRQDRAELHNLLGSVEEASGNFRDAAKEYEVAARLDPSEKNIFDLGTELLKYHGYSQALQIFTYGISRQPHSAQLRVGLGVAQYSLGEYRDAVETLCQAVDLDPKDTRALDFLGKMYDVAPELSDEVTIRLKRFAALYPQNPAANYYYALALRSSQQPDTAQAESLLKKAISQDPSFAEAHYQLGVIYQDQKLDTEAIEELKIAVKLRPDLKSAHYRLAQLYSKRGERALAREEYAAMKTTGTQ